MILQTKSGPVVLDEFTIAALKKVWPTKDIDAELARMHLRLLEKPCIRPINAHRFIRNWLKKSPDVIPPPLPLGAGWWKSEGATMEIADWIGIQPRPGEEMTAFRERLSKAVAAKRDSATLAWLPQVRAAIDKGMG